MRSRSCLLFTLLLTLSIANGASADPAARPSTSDSAAATEAVTYVLLDLSFDRVIARVDRDIAAMLQPTTFECSGGTDASGVELCVLRLEPAIAAVLPAAPAQN